MTKRLWVAAPLAAALAAAGIATAVAQGSAAGHGTAHRATRVAPAATVAISNCRLPKADFITNDVYNLSTTSTSYVAVPGMTKKITQGGSTSGCVVVNVSGYSYAPDGALEFVSVKLDGVQGSPYEVQFSGDDDEDGDGRWAQAHAAVFAFRGVAPGIHTISMVYNSFDGHEVFMNEPAMSIGHK
jgi:hypothetical protein